MAVHRGTARVAASTALLVLVACGGARGGAPGPTGPSPVPSASSTGPSGPPSASPSPTADPAAQRRVEIYVAVVRELLKTDPYDTVSIADRPCAGVSDPVENGRGACDDPFPPDDRQRILAGLPPTVDAEFVSDTEPVEDRIFHSTGENGFEALLRVGPIDGEGGRVEVEASAYCGGLCGHWMTFVVEESGDGWRVTGTTGPVAIA